MAGPRIKSYQQDQQTGWKNAIINPGMSVWQRGTVHSSPVIGAGRKYTSDRWFVELETLTTGQVEVRQVPLTSGGAIVALTDDQGYEMSGASCGLKLAAEVYQTGVSGAVVGSICRFATWVDLFTFAGETVTFSFWARQTLGSTQSLRVAAIQDFGPGGSADVQVSLGDMTDGGIAVLSPTFKRYTFTFDLPSLAGKIVDATGGCLIIGFDLPTISSSQFKYEITGCQLELGSAASPLEYRPLGMETALCQGYYEKTYAPETVPGTATTNVDAGQIANEATLSFDLGTFGFGYDNATLFNLHWKFAQQKVAQPSIAIYNPSTGTANQIYVIQTTTTPTLVPNVTLASVHATRDGIWKLKLATPVPASIVGAPCLFTMHATADAEKY